MKSAALAAGASALALAWCGVATAQTASGGAATPPSTAGSPSTVQEVVVTADRRTTNLQTTAVAATVLSQADLLSKGVFTVDQLQFVSPSLTVNNFGQGNDIDIRGIGKGEHNTQTGTGVVTYRDGVASFPGYFQEEPYYDVASVQVLRGPQGTFSGQNATGGAVIVNTQDPKINGGYTGYVLGHYGNYDDAGVQGAINLPINDTLAARVALNTEYHDSFYNIDGLTKGDPDVKWGSMRFGLLWQPTAALKVLWKTDYNYLDNGGYFGDSLTNPDKSHLFDIKNNYETYAVDQFVRSVLRVDYVIPDGITFRSVTGYQQGRTGWKGDIDGTDLPAPNYIINEASDENLFSQEINVISPDRGPVSWILGAYYQHNRYDFPFFDIGLPPGVFDENLSGVNDTNSWAGFGQLSVKLPAGFQVQAGLRYSTWSTTNHTLYYVPEYAPLLDQPQDERETGNNLTGKITLNWRLDAENFLYAFFATGAKPGGLNTSVYSYPAQPIPAPFRQEYVRDYEVGWKSQFLGNHLHTQLGFYYNDFDHFQVSIPLPNNPQFTTELNNPSSTKLYGIEASAQGVFGPWTLGAGLGWEHSELGAFFAQDARVGVGGTCDLEAGPASPTCINLSGNPQTYAPDLTYNLSVRYDHRLNNGDVITPSMTYSHVSDQYGTLFDNIAAGDQLAPRDILGASLAWEHNGYTLTLYGYNLTDDHYVSALLSPIRLAGNPRQFGISVLKPF